MILSEKAPIPKCDHHGPHGPAHHEEHCYGVFCESTYHATCLWENCACTSKTFLFLTPIFIIQHVRESVFGFHCRVKHDTINIGSDRSFTKLPTLRVKVTGLLDTCYNHRPYDSELVHYRCYKNFEDIHVTI